MKKLTNKLRRRKTNESEHKRITNETVAEHRERVLAGGRRFKYPVQYARHKLVINASIIGVLALIVLAGTLYWQLYPAQNTSTFFYRVTRVLPLPVAVVDGEPVPYSSYLVGFRSQEHYLQNKEGVNLNTDQYRSQRDFIKRQALEDAIADAYAAKLAREMGVSVSDADIDAALDRQRESRDGVTSKETYDAIVLDHFNWSPAEAREVTAARLLRQEVAYKIDETANKLVKRAQSLINGDGSFGDVAKSLKSSGGVDVTSGTTPLVPANNQDGGLAEAASRLSINQISKPIKSTTGDGYYFVKLLEKDDKNQVSYEFIKIPLTEFSKRLVDLRQNGLITEYISVPLPDTTLNNN